MSGPPIRDTAELKAQGGPVELIDKVLTQLESALEAVLEKRQAVAGPFGQDADKEMERICKSFRIAARAYVRQCVIEAYSMNRYVKTTHAIAPDAPSDTWEVAKASPELRVPTLPYGRLEKAERFDFDELFGSKR